MRNSKIIYDSYKDKENPCFYSTESLNTDNMEHVTGEVFEIENNCITLVEWALGTRNDQTVYTERTVLGEKICMEEYSL